MNFTNRVTSAACFDEKAYAEIALDTRGMKSALLVVILAGLSFGIGLRRADVFAWIDGVVATWVVFLTAVATAFLAAHKYDPSAWRWRRALRAIRILGYSMAPGMVGLVGFALGKTVVVGIAIWCAVSFLYGVRLAFDYKPKRVGKPIAAAIVAVSLAMTWVYSAAIQGGFGFVILIGFLGVCLFHKAFLRWLFGYAKTAGETKATQMGLRVEIRNQWNETQELLRKKGWDVSLRELVETVTLIRIRRGAGDGAAPEPPPIPEEPPKANGAAKAGDDDASGDDKAESVVEPEIGPVGSSLRADLLDADGERDKWPEFGPELDEDIEEEEEDEEEDEEPKSESRDEPEIEGEEKRAEPEGDARVDEGPAIRTVCDRIFDEKISGYESTQVFRYEFKGTTVNWRGTVKAVEQYTYDTVFGSDPGVKVLLEAAEIKTDYETLPVEVSLRLPPDKLELARAGIGKTISFVGELIENDPYARRLYVVGRSAD